MNGCRPVLYVASLIAGLLVLGAGRSPVLGQTEAESLSASFRKASERIAPAVVAVRPLDPAYPLTPGPIRPFEAPPRIGFRFGESDREPAGSGVVIDGDRGEILTNDHVLQGSSRVAVVFADGRERMVSQVRRDPSVDLAVLIVDPAGLNLAAAAWGDPASLRPGDWVLSVGQLGGGPPALSSGIFSARRRGMNAAAPAEEWIETDAAVNSVNSGGPLINLHGEVVGINTALAGRRGQVAGMGFALPADRARRVAADLVAFGQVRRAFLGVQVEPVRWPSFDRPTPPGPVTVASVTAGTPADEAGLRPGDVIVSIAGRPVAGVAMIQELVETAPIGENLTLTIERGGRRQDISVRPRARPGTPAFVPGIGGARSRSETGRDAIGNGVPRRDRAIPKANRPPPAPSVGADVPTELAPLPRPTRPQDTPSLESPKNQPEEAPR